MTVGLAEQIENSIKNPVVKAYSIIQDYNYLTSFAAILLGLYLVARHFTPKVSSEEPPWIAHPIPFVGHLLGIILHGVKYFDDVGRQTGYPIFTLPILNAKTYVITAPDLVTACMRETRTLSFNPFIVEVFRRLAHLTSADMEITKRNMDDKTLPSYMTDMHRVEYAALAPGPALDTMNEIVVNEVTTLLPQTLPSGNDSPRQKQIDLWATLQYVASLVAIRTMYGPYNPFDKDPSLLADFWLFEQDLKYLLIDIYPSITVRKAHLARERLLHAFIKYYQEDAVKSAALVVQDRYEVAIKHGQSLEVIAAFEIGLCFGILANSMPTGFWMIAHIYANPDLLDAIRQETAHLVTNTSATNSTNSGEDQTLTAHLISEKSLRTSCPLLTSTFHETLRVISSSLSSGRFVLQDTMLRSSAEPRKSYLLKAGSTVQIPSHSLHHPPASSTSSPFSPSNPQLNAAQLPSSTFSASRFQVFGPKLAAEPERSMNGSFRAFGGGAVLCPGRKFAFIQISWLVIVFVQLWDMVGLVEVPECEFSKVSVSVAKPKTRVVVGIKRRKGMEGKEFVREHENAGDST